MDPSEEALERYRAIEVPTGPWEEDENEDCSAYHTDVFRMFLMKVQASPRHVAFTTI